MNNLVSFLPQAEQIAGLIDNLMIDELGLMAPGAYELSARNSRIYLVASYDPLMLGRSLRAYENPEIARRLRTALGMPVQINKQTGTRFVVLMRGAVSLPRSVEFPISGAERDVFRLGIGLKGEVRISARDLRNVLLGAGQGMGKSSIEHLFAFQMLDFGWALYVADPQSHTFNPDIWNKVSAMPVAGSQEDMLKVLEAIESEMADRIFKFQMSALDGIPPEDIDAYNTQGVAPEPLPRIGFLIDEANYFMESKSIMRRLGDLLRQGRKWGLHIVLGGHEWHKETVPSLVNDMLQTRIALNSLSGAVVLRNHHWGKWLEGRPPGRGVLKTNTFEPMQFYLVGDNLLRGRLTAGGVPDAKPSPIPAREAQLVRRALEQAEGKMTIGLLMEWGMSEREARELTSRYEARGWLEKDPKRENARFVTGALVALVDEFHPNVQTVQTAQAVQTTVDLSSTLSKPVQTQE
jgi:hypothetical protein